MPELSIWLPTGRDLATIAVNIGIKQSAEPDGVLGQLASLLAAETVRENAAGLLYRLVAQTRPYDKLSELFALEAARVVLIANAFPAARINREHAERLWADVEAGRVTTAGEIGQRIASL